MKVYIEAKDGATWLMDIYMHGIFCEEDVITIVNSLSFVKVYEENSIVPVDSSIYLNTNEIRMIEIREE